MELIFLAFILMNVLNVNKLKKFVILANHDFCSSCGKKATEQWIENNLSMLPNVPWQHITFTLPQELRDFFWMNRDLVNHLVKNSSSNYYNTWPTKTSYPWHIYCHSIPLVEISKKMFTSMFPQPMVGCLLTRRNGSQIFIFIIKLLRICGSNK